MAAAPEPAPEAERRSEVVSTDGPEAPEVGATGRPAKRARKPRIDLDGSIANARAAMLKAQKEVSEARRIGRNERRKKQRLVKKASGLSPDDLERIAVLKRCGLGGPGMAHEPPTFAPASSSAGSAQPSSAGSLAASEHPDDVQAVRSPAAEVTPRGSDFDESDRS